MTLAVGLEQCRGGGKCFQTQTGRTHLEGDYGKKGPNPFPTPQIPAVPSHNPLGWLMAEAARHIRPRTAPDGGSWVRGDGGDLDASPAQGLRH